MGEGHLAKRKLVRTLLVDCFRKTIRPTDHEDQTLRAAIHPPLYQLSKGAGSIGLPFFIKQKDLITGLYFCQDLQTLLLLHLLGME